MVGLWEEHNAIIVYLETEKLEPQVCVTPNCYFMIGFLGRRTEN